MSNLGEKNPYAPILTKLVKTWVEGSQDKVKNMLLDFISVEDRVGFSHKPGQFCMLSISGCSETPFTIASSPAEDSDGILFVIEEKGSFTEAFYNAEVGSTVLMRGPLGKPFPIQEFLGRDILIVGDKGHLAPVRALLQYIIHPQQRGDFGLISVVLGHDAPSLLTAEQVEKIDEIGSIRISQLSRSVANEIEHARSLISAIREVSPEPSNSCAIMSCDNTTLPYLMRGVAEMGFDPVRVLFIINRAIRCGVGKCGRCNIGHRFTCIDGPAFSLKELEKLKFDV